MRFRIKAVKTFILKLTFFFLIGLTPAYASTATSAAANVSSESQSEVISAFTSSDITKDEQSDENKFRHKILFVMGILLLICIFTTAYFGISMALFDKQVFIPHMIAAGFTVFLATAHAVVAVVWFFPF